MTVAVISDVHGNLPALRAVLADVADAGAALLVSCGDLVSGPAPLPTLRALAAAPVQVVEVRGNADRGAVEAFDGVADTSTTHTDDLWTGTQLDPAARDHLPSLPLTATLEVEGLGRVLCCHGSPTRDDEIVLDTMPDDRLHALFDGVDAEVIVCGNTHLSFDRRVGDRRLVNPGSVGWSYGDTAACWALLGPDVQLRRTTYDLDAAAAELRRVSSWPDLDGFLSGVLYDPPTREDATAFFERLAADQS
jgi:putative phosphoesterase